jgi:acyl carrier protein
LAQLKARMPFANLTKFEADPQVIKLGEQLTVGDMVRYVESKIK